MFLLVFEDGVSQCRTKEGDATSRTQVYGACFLKMFTSAFLQSDHAVSMSESEQPQQEHSEEEDSSMSLRSVSNSVFYVEVVDKMTRSYEATKTTR